MERIEIYTSKKKSFLLLLGSLVFVALGIWLVMEGDTLTGWRARNPLFTKGIGFASILFFGLGIFVFIKRLVKSEIALVIDPIGLKVNPQKSTSESIKWEEINGFEEIKIQSTRILIISVTNPEYWLDKETNRIRKKMMQFNINNYNSPFSITTSGLNINSTELKNILNKYYERYKNEPQHHV